MKAHHPTAFKYSPGRRPWVSTALFTLFLGQLLTGQIHGRAEAADPYDTLYDVIMVRYAADGTSYAGDEMAPTIYSTSEFPFGDKTYKKFNAALDAFAALSQAKIEAYSDIKRALLQSHLWKVFDESHYKPNHPHRRAATQPKIASLIRRLALSRAQILALPDTRAATVKSGAFAQSHDPKNPMRPFLPADLYAKDSSWVCLGDADNPMPGQIHTQEASSRAMFLTFMRLPEGRAATLQFMDDRLKKLKTKFPVGTTFALVEQAFLISDEGEPVLSPLIVSIALRAYLVVDRRFSRKVPEPTQSVAEFVMQPRELMKGNAVMKAFHPDEFRYETGEGFFPPGHDDPFESGRMLRRTRLTSCMGCHGGKGINSIQTVINVDYSHFLTRRGPEVISKATSDRKRNHRTWKALVALWRADSKDTIRAAALPEKGQ